MARMTFWSETCEECGDELDTHEDEYMELEDEIWCMECYKDVYEDDDPQKPSPFASIQDVDLQVDGQKVSTRQSKTASPDFGDVDSTSWGIDIDDRDERKCVGHRSGRMPWDYDAADHYIPRDEADQDVSDIWDDADVNIEVASTERDETPWWAHSVEDKYEKKDEHATSNPTMVEPDLYAKVERCRCEPFESCESVEELEQFFAKEGEE